VENGMKRMWLVGAAGAILVCTLSAWPQTLPASSAPSIPPLIREIEISSTRVNLGGAVRFRGHVPPTATEPTKTVLDIRRNGDIYNLDDNVVDANLVAVLANALRAPVNPEPTREDLGFTPEWLKSNAASLAQNFATTTFIGGKPIHQSAFASAFTDPAAVDQAIPLLFRRRWCADCDRFIQTVEISVRFDDGTRIEARTSSEFPYMLPWHLQNDSKGIDAYNADVSRALAALMPENSTNRSRLSGDHLASELGHVLLMQEEHATQLREVESQTGGTMALIRTKYEVESASLTENGGDYAGPAANITGTSSNLVLRLKAADQPANFRDQVALAYVDGKVAGTERFMSDGQKFERLVLSVPWLTQYAHNHPRTSIEIAFVHHASLSDEALSAFSADMRAIGRGNVIASVAAQKGELAFVSVGSGMGRSDWLVLPDRHMLLWRFWRTPLRTSVTASELPAWSDSDYAAKPCVGSKNNFLHCVGREVSPDGNPLPLEQGIQ
jgi:hypothetical protein